MPELSNTFVNGVMNKDLDERLIPQGSYRHAENIDVDTSEGSNVGSAQNVLGNTKVADIGIISGQSVQDARTIGSVVYESGNLVYWFVASDFFDGIYEYNTTNGSTVRVLQSNKVSELTPSKLNFRKEYPITGLNFILGDDGNNYLYWTDDYNPPRRININRAKSYSIDDDRIDIDIDVALNPPMYAPSIEPFLDTTDPESNNIEERFVYFAYRYKYVDGQYSSLSPFSAVSFRPGDYEYDYGIGNNKSMVNIYNAVNITFETGNEFVSEIQLVVRDTKSINVCIVDSFSKSKLGISSDESYKTTFKNNKIYSVLSNEQVTRLFDNVPLLAKAQDVIGNRLAYGNYTQFRNIEDCDGNDININYRLALRSEAASVDNPKQTLRSDRDYEIGLVYKDDKGRMSTVLTAQDNSIYIPPQNSITANSIAVSIHNEPPCWATHYSVVIKQGRRQYYNIFPILFYAEGLFRYFLINESDRDKFKVGDYVIFKSDTAGATQSNKKYKILEFEQKPSGFLGGSQMEGLYFKIKVDSQSEFNPLDLFTFGYTANGTNYISLSNNAVYTPVSNRSAIVEYPIHYGEGNPNALTIPTQVNPSPGLSDLRYTVEIVDNTTFRYTLSVSATSGWITGTIVPNTSIPLFRDASGNIGCYIQFASLPAYEAGDRWKINVRSSGHLTGNYLGGVGIPTDNGTITPGDWGGAAVLPGPSWISAGSTERAIQPGAIIKLAVILDSLNPAQQYPEQTFISPSRYENIEEWFIESGAYTQFHFELPNGSHADATAVTFRRGSSYQTAAAASFAQGIEVGNITQDPNGAVYMIVQGFGYDNNDNNLVTVSFSIQQQEVATICETVAKDTDVDIYHEVFKTFPVKNGAHQVVWDYDDFEFVAGSAYTRLTQLTNRRPHYFNVGDVVEVTSAAPITSGTYNVIEVEDAFSVIVDFVYPGAGPAVPGKIKLSGSIEKDQVGFTPAVIEINQPSTINSEYNAWCWGNGLESDRIKDDFNETFKDYSLRVTTPVEDYKQVRSESAICYSGIFKQGSGVNRMNEFNLSLSNFKYLDRMFGSIQKLYARDTDLVVFQENKVSTVLYEKNILFDSVGGGQVVSIPEVLGTQVPISGEYGISKNPESFAVWGNDIFFTDLRSGLVLQMTGDQILEISSLGMKDYFRDFMKDNPNTQKLGAYDPHNHRYVLSTNDQRVIPCSLTLSRNAFTGPSNSFNALMFNISTDTNWTISLKNNGFGTNWVTNFATSGSGPQNIFADVAENLTGSIRTVTFTVSYCDGLSEVFVLTQGRGKSGKIVVAVFNNPTKI